jgi:hypothetical protein
VRIRTRLEEVWPDVQDRLVELEPGTPHVFAEGSSHYVQIEAPTLTIATVKTIFERAKLGRGDE